MIRELANLFGFGRVTLVDDDGELQRLQVTEGATGTGFADRVTDAVPMIGRFGFASVPPADSEVLLARRNGDRGKSIAIGTSHRPSRPKGLKPGDAGMYDVRGAKVLLTEDGLVIDCAGLPAIVKNAPTVTLQATDRIVLDAPIIECTGAITAKGDATVRTDGTAVEVGKLRDAYAAHKHGGVTTGTGVSGLTDKAV
ncbi:phage baseplate assembly protein V [Sphingomonas sp. Leaf25]|uniref:phage baseplate assembly protein V n=1 Tax=Sphingomonas sp. Leaf25 TaxID=1735692 RepID=UPI0007007111|nr:phage baseplate assembly protein V [Sphingomonas sp. Leaf25]KQN00574.1 hypothetical protein ASE78_05675 [Sphingomonas sp. Leaf25]